MKKLLLTLLSALIVLPANAQTMAPRDTSASAFDARQLIAPVALMTSGLGLHFMAHDTWDISVRNSMQNAIAGKPAVPMFEDWLQYVPLAMDLGVGLTGIKAEHNFLDRLIEGSLAYASLAVLSGGGKVLFHTLRPNGRDYKSFPSGHTSFVFCGAELVRLEYGWGWGSAAYAVACTVGFMRIYHDWHWMSDVIMGAGVGIICADIGYWLLGPLKRGLKINTDKVKLSVSPAVDPFSGIVCTQLALKF